LLESSLDPYQPGVVRASMGLVFWIPVVSTSFAQFVAWARRHAYHLSGSSARGGQDYRGVNYRTPCVLLLGSEREGLSADQRLACDTLLSLPMHGRATSLNLAVAAGVILFAMREKLGGDHAELSSMIQ
jgi:TrmH family RNA methyltransferase